MQSHIFNRRSEQVVEDATSLDLDKFLAKYKDSASQSVLDIVWRDNNKPKPEIKRTPVSQFNSDDKTTVSVSKVNTSTVIETDTNEKPSKKKGGKKASVEEEEIAPVKKDAPTKTRATRLRELIADKKDKAAAREILIAEGYDCGISYHSEWNRLNK